MKNLMESNIYEGKGKVLICGSCFPTMLPLAYKKIRKNYDMEFSLCLENQHINMAITKISGILSTGNITELCFASVDKSPHCVQMHYIKNEILRIMDVDKLPEIRNVVANNNEIINVTDDVISLSKNLIKLTKLHETSIINN